MATSSMLAYICVGGSLRPLSPTEVSAAISGNHLSEKEVCDLTMGEERQVVSAGESSAFSALLDRPQVDLRVCLLGSRPPGAPPPTLAPDQEMPSGATPPGTRE